MFDRSTFLRVEQECTETRFVVRSPVHLVNQRKVFKAHLLTSLSSTPSGASVLFFSFLASPAGVQLQLLVAAMAWIWGDGRVFEPTHPPFCFLLGLADLCS